MGSRFFDLIADMAARMTPYEDRVARLETMEFQTAGFGGGLALICDVTVSVATASITLCTTPATIPSNFRDLLILYKAQASAVFGAGLVTPLRLQFNGDTTTSYNYYNRVERAGPLDTEESSPSANTSDHIRVGEANGIDTAAPSHTGMFSSGYVWIPDYAYTDDDKFNCLVFGNWHRRPVGIGFGGELEYQAGGGCYFEAGALTSIRLFLTGGFTIQPDSRFTLYAL